MGASANALLVFGIDIGYEDGFGTLGPLTNEHGWPELRTDWYVPEAEDEDEEPIDFPTQLIATLAERAGPGRYDPKAESPDAYVKRTCGVKVTTWGHHDYEHWILAAAGEQFRIDSGGWGLHHLTVAELAPEGLADASAKLSAALDTLGLTTARAPGWLLVADYG